MKNKKTTTAFQLDPMPEPVTIVLNKKTGTWHPIGKDDTTTALIYGEGHVKIGKWKKEVIQPLSNPYTAKEVQAVKNQFGYHAAMGMIKGWSCASLDRDLSYGLASTKHEVCNMADLGEAYDTFTDQVQAIGDEFVECLLQNGFRMENKWLWYGDYLVGRTGIYEKIRIHPLQHIDHCLTYAFLGRSLPSFNSLTLDEMLVQLFIGKYHLDNCDFTLFHEMSHKYVSIYDRIAHLTSKDIADKIFTIFELTKKMNLTFPRKDAKVSA